MISQLQRNVWILLPLTQPHGLLILMGDVCLNRRCCVDASSHGWIDSVEDLSKALRADGGQFIGGKGKLNRDEQVAESPGSLGRLTGPSEVAQ